MSCTSPSGGGGIRVVTPGGARCGALFITGALLEVYGSGGDLVRARVADPTGAFEISAGRQNADVSAVLKNLTPPVFVSVTGESRMYSHDGRSAVSVMAEDIRVIDRAARDTWLLRTADLTLGRIAILHDAISGGDKRADTATVIEHYAISFGTLRELLDMVESALASVRPPGPEPPAHLPDPRGLILEILKAESGPRGTAVETIVTLARERGISSDDILRAIRSLVEEDDCYQPAKGMIKLL